MYQNSLPVSVIHNYVLSEVCCWDIAFTLIDTWTRTVMYNPGR